MFCRSKLHQVPLGHPLGFRHIRIKQKVFISKPYSLVDCEIQKLHKIGTLFLSSGGSEERDLLV